MFWIKPVIGLLLALGVLFLIALVLAARSWRFAAGLRAFLRFCASPFTYLGEKISEGQKVCKGFMDKSLHWQGAFLLHLRLVKTGATPALPAQEEEKDWRLPALIYRLVLLLAGLSIFGGDLPFTQFRNKALLQIEQTTHIPLPLDVLGAILWLVVPAICGEMLWEVCGGGVEGARLLPQTKRTGLRWLLGLVTGCLLALAIFDTFLLFYYGQYPVAFGEITPAMQQLGLWIVALFGALVAVVAVPALRAIYMGLEGVVCVSFGVVFVVLLLPSLVCGLVTTLFEKLEDIVKAVQPIEVVAPPPVKITPIGPVQIIDNTKESLPTYIEGEPGNEGEQEMNIDKRTTVLLGCGQQLSALLQPISYDVLQFGASDHILGYTIPDPESQKHLRLPPIPGALNLSPSARDMKRAQDGSHTPGETLERLIPPTIVNIKDAYANRLAGTIVLFVDYLLIPHLLTGLEEIKQHMPLAKILLVTALPAIGPSATELEAIYQQMVTIKQQRVIDAILLFDDFSPYAKKFSKKQQQRYISRCFVTLLKAHDHAPEQNPAFEDIVNVIGRMGDVCSFAFATSPIVQGEPLKWWKVLRRFRPNLPPRGQGDIGDVMTQTEAMFRRILVMANTHALTTPIDSTKPMLYLVNIPLSPAHERFDETVQHINRQIRELAQAYPIIMGASGIPDPQYGNAGYFASAFCIYPVVKLELLPAPETIEAQEEASEHAQQQSQQ